ncbi:hypothetical protein [Streptomyces globisporus]|uniref:hypothetical protein n=1 Tax=Streptomyces globisporus TaxID=1908 RepID=UPI00379F9D37
MPELFLCKLMVSVCVQQTRTCEEASADGDNHGTEPCDDDPVGWLKFVPSEVRSIENPRPLPQEPPVTDHDSGGQQVEANDS